MYASNLSMAEHYRLNGSVTREQVEAAIELLEKMDGGGEEGKGFDAVSGLIEEARTGLYGEDFLCDLTDRIRKVMNGMRKGAVKEELLIIVQAAEELQMSLFNQGEYARDELRKAMKILKGAGL